MLSRYHASLFTAEIMDGYQCFGICAGAVYQSYTDMSPDYPEVITAEELKKLFPIKRKANEKPSHKFDDDRRRTD